MVRHHPGGRGRRPSPLWARPARPPIRATSAWPAAIAGTTMSKTSPTPNTEAWQ